MARKRDKQDVRASVAAAAGRLTFGQVGAALTEAQLDVLADLVTVSNPLPPEYRAFLLLHNGGDPEPAYFAWEHPQDGAHESHLDSLLGLDPRSPADPLRGVDALRMTLKFRDELPEWATVVGFADRDDLLLLFEDGPRAGQVWVKYWEEVPAGADDPRDREAGLYRVAGSFTDLLGMLRASSS